MSDRKKKFIGNAALAARYERSVRTIFRWVEKPPPGFPTPVKIHNRYMWDLDEIEAYEASHLRPQHELEVA